MEWLRVEFGGELLDPLRFHDLRIRSESPADLEILQIQQIRFYAHHTGIVMLSGSEWSLGAGQKIPAAVNRFRERCNERELGRNRR